MRAFALEDRWYREHAIVRPVLRMENRANDCMFAVPPVFARKCAPRYPLTRGTASSEVLFKEAARGGIPYAPCGSLPAIGLPSLRHSLRTSLPRKTPYMMCDMLLHSCARLSVMRRHGLQFRNFLSKCFQDIMIINPCPPFVKCFSETFPKGNPSFGAKGCLRTIRTNGATEASASSGLLDM